MQRELLVAMDYRMAGVVAALLANDVIEIARDEIGDFALAFIAPLGADEHGAGHGTSFPQKKMRGAFRERPKHLRLG